VLVLVPAMQQELSANPNDALYTKMMRAINPGHTWGNRMRMLKLPLILTDAKLYGFAIAQFYELTQTLEHALDQFKEDPLVQHVLRLGLHVTPGYEADLQQLLGQDWRKQSKLARTGSTMAYCEQLQRAGSIELVAASFILYGALVIGGGKATQKKVKKIFPSCSHSLFDVADDMSKIRRAFKECFNTIGEEYPEYAGDLAKQAARFMALNNTVVLSARCLPFWWPQAAVVCLSAVAVAVAIRLRMQRPMVNAK